MIHPTSNTTKGSKLDLLHFA